jgi:hypothetical protein
MKKDDLQTIDQIHLLSQKNASNSDDTMAKEKGLDEVEVNLPVFFCQGPCGLTPLARMTRTLLDNKKHILFSIEMWASTVPNVTRVISQSWYAS